MRTFTYLFVLAGLLIIGSCDKDTNSYNASNTIPTIDSLTTSMSEITFGSTTPAVLECYATGGDLTYTWEVDLGELFTTNDSGSQAQYTASPCCMGKKVVSCTVSNNIGELTESIMVTITE